LREESILDDAARKELNPRIRPDLFSMLRKSRPQEQIEIFQNPFQKKIHEIQSKSQQQYSRSRHPVKRLKVRSIVGSPHEVDDNEVHEFIHKSILEEHDKGSIYIKPVFRVTTKTSIFDSIMDILHQLLVPKKELGPIVGPIHKPGSKHKIYLRLLEPVDTSHINVRFVTQIPVPVVDEESREHESVLSFLPFVDPSFTFLNRHPVESSDAIFSSSNRHPSIQLPQNASHVSDKDRESQPAIKLKRPPLEETAKKNVLPVKMEASSGTKSNKNLYYQFQSENDAIKEVTEIIENATENEQNSKDSLEPWYQLSTHHLPLRQIAPLYPLSMMEHTDSNSYEDTYKVPSDSLIVPSPHLSSYEQYSNVNAAPEFYDQSYTMPNTYTTIHQEQNEFSNTPSFHPISYQNQNEFNNVPSSTSQVKQNDLLSAPSTYTSSYKKKPATVPAVSSSYVTSHEMQNGVQTGSSSQNALRVIDPPAYFFDPRQVSENHANKVFKYPIQSNSLNINGINSSSRNTAQKGELPIDQVTWGKVKREKSESNFQKSKSNFQKSAEIISDDNREKWQPLMFVSEDADWHKAFANLAEIANDNYHETVTKQSVNHSRQVSRNTTPSTIQTGRVDQHQNGKRHNSSVATTRNSKCSISNKEDRCERTESTIISTLYPEGTTKIIKEQTQSIANIESTVITSIPIANNTVETLRSNITKNNWIKEPQPLVMTTESLATNSTTESPLLIKMIKNMTEKSIKNKTTLSGSTMSNLTEEKIASSTTERSSISGTSEASIPKSTAKRLQLPKRPMIMKNPIFLLKRRESSSTTKRTVASSTTRKPAMSSTTEKTRRSKYRSAVSKTKSNTT